MNPHQLKRLFPNASQSVIAANARDYGDGRAVENEIPPAQHAKQAPALDASREGEAQGPGRIAVRFSLRKIRLLDADAKYSCVKDLLDGLQYAGLIHGDREDQIALTVEQEKVSHRNEQETIIEITYP